MFKSEAKLFLSANNNVNYAKTLINECKRLIANFDLQDNSNYSALKSNINNCNIDGLVTKIEDTKESLIKLDQCFAGEYMTLLQEYFQTATIDTSNLTAEEKMQYSIQMNVYARDYNQNLLYMLEKAEESGMLTDEMEQHLKYQRELVSQYDIKDKMSVLDTTSSEYINLFKKCAVSDKLLINLDPSLTKEEKTIKLKEYNIQYNEDLTALLNARNDKLKREEDIKELEELYKSKEDNNGFFHPFVESEIDEAILDKKIEMGIASEDEISYKNMNSWERFCVDTETFVSSTFTGLYNITEGIGDGFVMLGSSVGICDKNWATDYVSRDLSGELYQGIQLSNNMNSYSAYGTWHIAGEIFGGTVGKIGMSFTAPWMNAALSGLDSMGQSAEMAINNGDEYWTAFGKSVVSGIGGAAEGAAYSKMNLGIRNFLNSGTVKALGSSVLSNVKNFGSTLASPGGIKVVGENLLNLAKTSAKSFPSVFGKAGLATLTEVDALVETGCVLANNIIECATSGEWDFDKMLKEAGTVFAINYFMNFMTSLAIDINMKNKSFENTIYLYDYDGNEPTVDLFSTEKIVPDKYISFSKKEKKAIKQLSDYYGDAGYNINNMFKQGKTANQILNELDGKSRSDFENFLKNTREGRFLAKLSVAEIDAITTYTGGYFDIINNMLRSKNLFGTIKGIDAKTLIANIDIAIAKYGGLDEATEIYRAVEVSAFTAQNSTYSALFNGIDVSDLNQVYCVLKQLEGKEFGDFGYMSTSPGYSTSFAKFDSYPIVLDIIADKGTAGAYINQISNFYNMENEFLLARDTVLQMVEVLAPEKDINGLEKIVIKCVVK